MWNMTIGVLIGLSLAAGVTVYAGHLGDDSSYSPSREFGRSLDSQQLNRNQQRLYVDPVPGSVPLYRQPC